MASADHPLHSQDAELAGILRVPVPCVIPDGKTKTFLDSDYRTKAHLLGSRVCPGSGQPVGAPPDALGGGSLDKVIPDRGMGDVYQSFRPLPG